MKNIMSNIKKLTAGVLAVGMLVAGVVVAPKQAEATETAATTNTATVICEAYTDTEIKSANYWTADSRIAPLKSGYVFGGWFRTATVEDTDAESLTLSGTAGNYAPLTEDEMTDVMNDANEDTLYAKFVPAQVLSVKAQNEENTETKIATLTTKKANGEEITAADAFWVRVMTSLDSKNYKSVGFDIYLANKKQVKKADGSACETTKVYSKLIVKGAETSANAIFGGVSQYACVWKLDKIDTPSNADKIIYVRPYWYTMDGTKVLGLAKYVHIEDEYMNYISVPVNLLDGQNVAAGEVHMTYADTNAATASAWEVKEVEAGRVLPEMSAIVSEGTIKMVGNAKTVGVYSTDLAGERETIFANVRFKRVVEDATAETPTYIADTEDVTFTTVMKKFCDWTPQPVTISNIGDVKHDATETVSP